MNVHEGRKSLSRPALLAVSYTEILDDGDEVVAVDVTLRIGSAEIATWRIPGQPSWYGHSLTVEAQAVDEFIANQLHRVFVSC